MNGGIIQLLSINSDTAKAILRDSRYSPISRLEQQYNISIAISNDRIDELANITPKFGVRGIYSELQEKLCDALFENSESTSITL